MDKNQIIKSFNSSNPYDILNAIKEDPELDVYLKNKKKEFREDTNREVIL